MNYAFQTFKKIDIYLKNAKGFMQYECSTNASRTCKEAKTRYLRGLGYGLDDSQVVAKYAK